LKNNRFPFLVRRFLKNAEKNSKFESKINFGYQKIFFPNEEFRKSNKIRSFCFCELEIGGICFDGGFKDPFVDQELKACDSWMPV